MISPPTPYEEDDLAFPDDVTISGGGGLDKDRPGDDCCGDGTCGPKK